MSKKSDDTNNIKFNIDVECEEDPKELRKKLIDIFHTANKEFAEQFYEDNQDEIDTIHSLMHCLTFKPTEDENIMESKIPTDAYDEDGELKESYRKAYRTILEENRKQNKELLKNAIESMDDDAPEPVELADSTSFQIKYIINDLIENTGIIEGCTLIFKRTLTPVIFKTLNQYASVLNDSNLNWRMEDYDNEYVTLILGNRISIKGELNCPK
ncbi:hypothetical protein [Methanobrevibacter sp.]|uniref:hypothetical protein n=1 Tax=Methanobrevibacter sp. TaxID=66852 RepID=UPI0038664CAC